MSKHTFAELREICLSIPEPVAEMSMETRVFHMRYKTPRSKEVWKYVAPKGRWFLRFMITPVTIVANVVILYLVYHLVLLDGMPIIGSLQL